MLDSMGINLFTLLDIDLPDMQMLIAPGAFEFPMDTGSGMLEKAAEVTNFYANAYKLCRRTSIFSKR